MNIPRCSIEGCTRDAIARKLCSKHYGRLWRSGLPTRQSCEERFWAFVNKTDSCWLWTGSLNSAGYGMFHFSGSNHQRLAHRCAYEFLVGPILEGLTLDHVKSRGCTSRACVNPAHLEPVPMAVNILRGNGPAARNARKTHCQNGHEFTPENTRLEGPGRRRCRACLKTASRPLAPCSSPGLQ